MPTERSTLERSTLNYSVLKTSLLNGNLLITDFLRELMDADQNDPNRTPCKDNIAILTDSEVRDYILNSNEDLFDYYNLLSLSYCHAGQQDGIEVAQALNYFKQSLAMAELAPADEGYNEWKNYISGLVAFYEKDFNALEVAIKQLSDGVNKDVLNEFYLKLQHQ